MKKLFVLAVALFTLLSLSALAQEAGGQKKEHKMGAKTGAMAAHSLTGTIGEDGKTFTNDADQSSWTISNPDKVKGHEGHKVKLTAAVDETNKSLDVKTVKMPGHKAASSHKPMTEKK